MQLSLRLAVFLAFSVILLASIVAIMVIHALLDASFRIDHAKDELNIRSKTFKKYFETYFNSAAFDTVAIRDSIIAQNLPLPCGCSDQQLEQWLELTDRPAKTMSGATVAIALTDGSLIRSKVFQIENEPVLSTHIYIPGPNITFFRYRHLLNMSDVPPFLHPKYPYNVMNSSSLRIYRQLTNMSDEERPEFQIRLAMAVPTEMILVDVMTLYSSTGQYIGMCVIGLPFFKLSEWLAINSASNDRVYAFVVRPMKNPNETEMIMSSLPNPVVTKTPYNDSGEDNTTVPVPKNCITSVMSDKSTVLACRELAVNYPFSALSAGLPHIDPGVNKDIELNVKGQQFFLVIRDIKFLFESELNFSLLLYYDLGALYKRGKPFRILMYSVGTGMIILAILLVGAGVYFALTPISLLGKRLSNAAGLRKLSDSGKRSLFREVRDLETAFAQLYDSLQSIKVYLPSALFSAVEDQAKGNEIKRKRLLEDINVFRSVDASMLFLHCPMLLTLKSLTATAAAMSKIVVDAIGMYGGVVERLHPNLSIISFNCHVPCYQHQVEAARCAVEIHRNLDAQLPSLQHFIFVDTGTVQIGTAGYRDFISPVLVSAQNLFHLASLRLQMLYLPSRVLFTDNIARTVASSLMLPVDMLAITPPDATPHMQPRAVLYEPGLLSPAITLLRRIFLQMIQGKFDVALASMNALPKSLPPLYVMHIQRWCGICEDLKARGVTEFVRQQSLPWESMGNKPAAVQEADSVSERAQKKLEAYAAELLKPKEIEEGGLFGYIAVGEQPMMPLNIVDSNGTKWVRSLGEIGKGASSSVFIGMSHRGQISAMKFLRLDGIEVSRIQSELQVLLSLKHRNVAEFISFAIEDVYVVLISEYLPWGTLDDERRAFGSPFHERFLFIAYDILKGLEYLHSQGIVHCDLKPSNVLVSANGTCKLTDFGSALQSKTASSCKDVSDLRGTWKFMAPEVALGNVPTFAADVWSFGRTLQSLIEPHSERPKNLPGHSAMKEAMMIREIASGKNPSVNIANQGMKSMVEKCLESDAVKRPTVAQLLTSPIFLWGLEK